MRMLGDQRLCPWCMFLCWCLQEAPQSPAAHLHSICIMLNLTFRSATDLPVEARTFSVPFLPLIQNFVSKIVFPFFLKTLAFGLLLQRQYPEVGTPVPALSGSLFPMPVPYILLSCLRLSASLDIMT